MIRFSAWGAYLHLVPQGRAYVYSRLGDQSGQKQPNVQKQNFLRRYLTTKEKYQKL